MNTDLKLPSYVKISVLLIGLYVFISILSIAKGIILPVLYATILAILISPVVSYLVKHKVPRVLSITGVLLASIVILIALVSLLLSQVNLLSDAMPQLTDKFQDILHQGVSWMSGQLNISEANINTWLSNAKEEFINKSSGTLGNTLSTMGSVLAVVLLTPVYIFMILYYQPHLVRFLHNLFGTSNDNHVSEILVETKTIVQRYLMGLLAELAIVAVLNSVGLLILGMPYAILLGIVGALLNIIPYIGGIFGLALFAIIALVTKAPVYVLYVLLLYTVIQLIDNNYLVPKIIGSKVKLNALISLLAVIAGAALWGVPGMFISIPLIAIVKVIFDRIEYMKPWGLLMGDTMPPMVRLKGLKAISKKLPRISPPLVLKARIDKTTL